MTTPKNGGPEVMAQQASQRFTQTGGAKIHLDKDKSETNRAAGMTLHQHYAGLAMQGLLCGSSDPAHDASHRSAHLAENALKVADAMIAAYAEREQ